MPDVEINLIGHDRTGNATRSAANNLDQLARKVDKFNAKTIGDNKSAGPSTGIRAAARELEQLQRKAKKKFVVRAGFDPEFVRDVKNIPNLIPNLFSRAGARARERFKKSFGSPGLDPEFVRDIKKIPVFFSTAGARSRAAFKRELGSPGFDPDFVRDIQKIPVFFSRTGARARRAFNSAFGKSPARRILQEVGPEDKDARSLGERIGNAFTNALVNAINDGTRAIGNAIRKAVTISPALQAAIPFFAARLAGLLGQALTAAFA